MRSVSIWSPLVWLDKTIHEHYWISTGWTNRPDGVGSAGGRSQTAGESIRTGDLGNIGKAAGDWRHLLISRRTNQSDILWLSWSHSRLCTACLHQYGEWRKRCVWNMKVLIELCIFNLVSRWESNKGLTLESWQMTHHWRSMQLQAAQSQSPSLQWLILLIVFFIYHSKELLSTEEPLSNLLML